METLAFVSSFSVLKLPISVSYLSVIPIAAVSGTLRIHKKKRFLIEDEDEDY